VKIKPAPHKKEIKTKAYHYWLAEPSPRKKGRLARRNKANKRRAKFKSEFILMCEQKQADESSQD